MVMETKIKEKKKKKPFPRTLEFDEFGNILSDTSLSSRPRELKLGNQCKVCSLLHTHPDLWTEAHDKVLKENFSQTSVCKWLNTRINVINSKIEKEEDKLRQFTIQNLNRHFSKHNDFELQQTLQRQRILSHNSRLSTQQGFSDDEVEHVREYGEELVSSQFQEYASLVKMVSTLESKLWKYDEQLGKKDEKNPNRSVDLDEISGYQKQIESLMKLKMDLSKYRNSSAVTGAAIESSVQHTVSSFVEVMMEITEEAQGILQAELPGSSLPHEISKLIRNKIADTMKAVVPLIVDRVLKDFKIK